MKKVILIMTLFGLTCCSPRNPYYLNHLSDLPYNVFFEAELENNNNYDLNGESNSSNGFEFLLPDNMKGGFDTGDCVAQVELNKSNQITDVNIIGMTLFKKPNTITRYDRYAVTSKRINYKIDPLFDEYVQFIKDMIGKLRFTNKDNTTNHTGKAYVKIVFHKKDI
jgi:hypothetical protein